jgi:hypothetical protein
MSQTVVTNGLTIDNVFYPASRTYGTPQIDKYTGTIPANSTNFEIDISIIIASMRALLISSDQAVTVKTNSSGAPAQTFLFGSVLGDDHRRGDGRHVH